MTNTCEHPIEEVEVDEAGRMYFGEDGPADDCHLIYFCKKCRQVVDEKDLPWLHEPSGTEPETIPY